MLLELQFFRPSFVQRKREKAVAYEVSTFLLKYKEGMVRRLSEEFLLKPKKEKRFFGERKKLARAFGRSFKKRKTAFH